MQYNKQTTTNFTAVSQCTTGCNVNVYIRFIDFSLSFGKTTSSSGYTFIIEDSSSYCVFVCVCKCAP